MRALERTLGKQDAVVGDDADGIAVDVREAGHQSLAVTRLEFVQIRAVDNTCNDFADIKWPARVLRDHAVQLVRRILRFDRFAQGQRHGLAPIEAADNVARDG